MKKFFIVGCGGHARSVIDVLQFSRTDLNIILIDSNARVDEKILGCCVVPQLPEKISEIHVAVGDIKIRKQFVSYKQRSVISHDAYISPFAVLETGIFVGHYAHVGPEAKIGFNTIINTKAVIEHEVSVGNLCNISPGVIICGKSKIGNEVMIGAGSTIIDKVKICDKAIIGAGSVVTKNIDISGVYMGCPARLVRELLFDA